MPSESYSNYAPRDEFSGYGGGKKERQIAPMLNRGRRLQRGMQGARNAYNQVPKERQKDIQNKLKQIQRTAPNLGREAKRSFIAGRPTLGFLISAWGIFRYIDWGKDWMFIILASFALLKDILDLAFAAVGTASTWIAWVPLLGQLAAGATVVIGMTVSFVFDVLLLTLTSTVLVLVGSSMKNRALAKYIAVISVGFIAEMIPGLDWLPLAFIEVFVVWGLVLFDRAFEAQSAQASGGASGEIPQDTNADAPANIPQSGAADSYGESMAA